MSLKTVMPAFVSMLSAMIYAWINWWMLLWMNMSRRIYKYISYKKYTLYRFSRIYHQGYYTGCAIKYVDVDM